MKQILEVFKTYAGNVTFDNKLAENIKNFKRYWEMKGEHIEFLAGHTMGEQKVVFSVTDWNRLTDEVLRIDTVPIRKAILKLPDINPEFKTVSDYRFHILTWLMYGFTHSKLPTKERDLAIDNCFIIMGYMKISSLITYRIPRRTPKDVAAATYEALHGNFILKREGTWDGLFRWAARDMHPRIKERHMKADGVHYKRIMRGTTEDFVLIIMGIMTKFTEFFTNIYTVANHIEQNGLTGKTTSLINEFDDNTTLKELTESPSKHVKFLQDIVVIKTDFVNHKLIKVVGDIRGNIDEDHLKTTLAYISDHYLENHEQYTWLFNVSILEGVAYLSENGIGSGNIQTRIEEALVKLNGRWITAKGQSETVYKFKDIVYKLARTATGKKSKSMLTSVTIGVGLYFFLRAISRHKV